MAGTGLVVVGASNSTVVGVEGGVVVVVVINDNKLTVCPSGSCGGLN